MLYLFLEFNIVFDQIVFPFISIIVQFADYTRNFTIIQTSEFFKIALPKPLTPTYFRPYWPVTRQYNN